VGRESISIKDAPVTKQLAIGRTFTIIKFAFAFAFAFAAGAKVSAAFVAFELTAFVSRNMPNDKAVMVVLPDALWARRIAGVLGNELSNRDPDRMFLILTQLQCDPAPYKVSIQAAKSYPYGRRC